MSYALSFDGILGFVISLAVAYILCSTFWLSYIVNTILFAIGMFNFVYSSFAIYDIIFIIAFAVWFIFEFIPMTILAVKTALGKD